MSKFGFNPKSQRFHYTSGDRKGEFVSQDVIKRFIDIDYINSRKPGIEKLGQKLIDEKIDVTTWESEFRAYIKELHINAYTLGKGGLKQLTPRDWGIIGNRLGQEYTYLRSFTNQLIQTGMTEKRFLYRSKMYVSSAFASYVRGMDEGHRLNGFFWQKDTRNASESCDQCREIEGMGWVMIGSTPPIGHRQCKVNCRCTREYSNDLNKPGTQTMTELRNKLENAIAVIEASKAMERPLTLVEINQLDIVHTLKRSLSMCGEGEGDRHEVPVNLSDAFPAVSDTGVEVVEHATPKEGGEHSATLELKSNEIVVTGFDPTPAQLKKINQFLPYGAGELTANDVITVPVACSNNLVQWSNDCWHPRSLVNMKRKLLGRNFLTDHGDEHGGIWGTHWDSINTHQGVIYNTTYNYASDAPRELINTATHRKVNERIVADMGYHELVLDVFFPRQSAIAQKLAYGLLLDVSTGTMGSMKYYCPDCSNFFDKKLVEYKDCPHIPPTRYIMRQAEAGYLSDEEKDLITDYYVADGVHYGVETSFVVIGNLPNARVIRNFDTEKEIYAP